MECYSISNRKRWPKKWEDDEPSFKPTVFEAHLFSQSTNMPCARLSAQC